MNTRLRQPSPTCCPLCLLQEQFIKDWNHELRTPLTVILGSLELLRDQKAAKEVCSSCSQARSWWRLHVHRSPGVCSAEIMAT